MQRTFLCCNHNTLRAAIACMECSCLLGFGCCPILKMLMTNFNACRLLTWLTHLTQPRIQNQGMATY